MAGGQQVPGQRAGPAAELEHHAAAHRGQEIQDAGRAVIPVLAVTEGVHQGEIVLVILHGQSVTTRPRWRARNGARATSWTLSILAPRSDS